MKTTTPSSTRLITPTLNTAGLSAQEIKDRRAIQDAWVKYWDVTIPLLKTPSQTWRKTLATVSAEPLLSDVLQRAMKFRKNGTDNYGYVLHNFYWGPSVNGDDSAIVGDCMDTSHIGTLNVKTGVKLTVGVKQDNTRVSFLRSGNIWRAINIQYLDGSC